MNSHKLVSIIVPVHNSEQYLDKCLNSLTQQSYKNIEIFLVENNSSDCSLEMCYKWQAKDDRIVVFTVNTVGAAAARNYALDRINGDYILFVDSDDWCETDMIEILVDSISQFNADVAVCNYQINEEKRICGINYLCNKSRVLQEICTGSYKYGVLWNKLYRRNLVSNTRMPNLICSEDLVFNYYFFKKANVIAESDDNLYHYYQNESSTVHGQFGIGAFDALEARRMIYNDVKDTAMERYALKGLVSSCFVLLSGIIQYTVCFEKFDEIRLIVKKNKFKILFSKLFTFRDKFKTVILCISKKLYCFLVRS